ncbi:hypothetical protein KFK09_002702 [Dendrobium nobile]|uniref:Uncharacterized protein n=1 Tax=Dendrobium nobile TaxID=94219 RepID=A0A8T3C2E3_DENNO|nr:hypothetical protein KFK09_002702 [Dendrobium nobile]
MLFFITGSWPLPSESCFGVFTSLLAFFLGELRVLPCHVLLGDPFGYSFSFSDPTKMNACLTTKHFTASRPCRSRCFFAFVARKSHRKFAAEACFFFGKIWGQSPCINQGL